MLWEKKDKKKPCGDSHWRDQKDQKMVEKKQEKTMGYHRGIMLVLESWPQVNFCRQNKFSLT